MLDTCDVTTGVKIKVLGDFYLQILASNENFVPTSAMHNKDLFLHFFCMQERKMRKSSVVGKGSEIIKRLMKNVNAKTKNREIVDGKAER